ncbi:hypothetical protein [Nocardiopsis sp. YSL2]|uniref:hypothetical protein n=1 Tax=Nocardiopsis sp. YSL2 TaxID=2939492 RepID=UPI0026F41D9C|nr:hypothetical protein [Nocardiopsis sp. YSL2]
MTGFADGLGDARRAVTAYFGFHAPERRSAGEPEGGDLLDDIGDTVHGAELPVLDRASRTAPPESSEASATAGPPEPPEPPEPSEPSDPPATGGPEAAEGGRPASLAAIDDLDRQPRDAVPDDHHRAVDELVADLESRAGWAVLPLLGWSCGVLVLVRM